MDKAAVLRAGKDKDANHGFQEYDWIYVAHPVTEADIKAGIHESYNKYVGAFGFIAHTSRRNADLSYIYFNKEFREKFGDPGVKLPNWMFEPCNMQMFNQTQKENLIELLEKLREETSHENIYLKAVDILVTLGKTEYKDVLVRMPK